MRAIKRQTAAKLQSAAWLRGQALAIACLSAVTAHAAPDDASAGPCALAPGPARTVTRIIDGETVTLDDGSEVRLIGALAPRARDANAAPGAWPLEEAARTSLANLTLGKKVELAFGSVKTDRYGRLLAHLFLSDADGRTWVQGELLRHGLARAYALPRDGTCLAELLAHETLARRQRRGVWALPLYAHKPAAKTGLLAAGRSTFQIVKGKVVSVSRTKGAVYLNFGDDWKSDVTVRISRGVLKAHPEWGKQLDGLKSRSIEVRGWIERRNGPLIAIAHPGEIITLPEGEDDTAPDPGAAPAPVAGMDPTAPGSATEPAVTAPAAGQPGGDPDKENRPERKAPGDVDL